MKRAVLYARVSTPRQKVQGVSLDTQQEMARARCAAEGWTLTHTYMDVMTGKSPRRPGILQLIEDAKKKKFDVAMIYRIDRGGRTARFWHGELLATLDDHDVGLVSLTQDIDATTPDGRFLLGQYILLAEKESADISKRVSDNMHTLAARGRWVAGGRVPFGYRYRQGHLNAEGEKVIGEILVEPAEAEVVATIFERYVATRSIMGVVAELNEAGRRTRRGSLWRADTVRHILANPVYAGHIAYGKFKESGPTRRRVKQAREDWTIVKDAHEAIVDQGTFDAASDILTANEKKAPRVKYAERRHPWSGLLVCVGCGRKMVRHRVTASGPYAIAYICPTYFRSGKAACPNYAYLNAQMLVGTLLPALAERCREFHAIQAAQSERPAARPRRQPANPAARIAELEATKARAYEAYVLSPAHFPADRRDAIVRECDEKIAALMAQVTSAATSAGLPPLPDDLLGLWDGLDEGAQGALLRGIIEKIEVSHTACRIGLHPADLPGWQSPLVFPVPRRQRRPDS